MTHLYLIRHADYIYDLVDGEYPKRNLGLSPKGVKQAEQLRDRLARTGEIAADVLISSTERGAQETAEIVAPALGQPIIFDQDVEEWRSEDGNLSTEEFMGRWRQTPDPQKPFLRWIEGCETWVEFSVRAQSALNRIVHQHAGKRIVIISHGGVVQASFEYFFGYGLATHIRAAVDTKNTSITHWFKLENGTKWILGCHNDHHHLEEA